MKILVTLIIWSKIKTIKIMLLALTCWQFLISPSIQPLTFQLKFEDRSTFLQLVRGLFDSEMTGPQRCEAFQGSSWLQPQALQDLLY